jgi:hypothetical protein
MADLQHLARRARRAGELGRLRAAARGATVILPLAALCAVIGGSVGECICIGVLLFATAVGLGWWHADGARATRLGLLFGLIPLTASLVTIRLGGALGTMGALDPCGPLCGLAGVIAGSAAAYYAVRVGGQRHLQRWGAAALMASLTAALGCAPMGLSSSLVVVGSVLIGTLLAVVPWPARLT